MGLRIEAVSAGLNKTFGMVSDKESALRNEGVEIMADRQ